MYSKVGYVEVGTHAFALDFEPLDHSCASASAACLSAFAFFALAASALRACPAAFLDISPPLFLGAGMVLSVKVVSECALS